MKNRKLSKAEKIKIGQVVKKWNPNFVNRNLHKGKSSIDFLIAGVLLTDVFTTGGAMTVIFASFAGYFGYEGTRSFRKAFLGTEWENKANQKVKSAEDVKFALRKMEVTAKNIFNQVSKDGLKANKKKDDFIIGVLSSIQDDINILNPVYKIKHDVINNDFKIKLDDLNNLSDIHKNRIVVRKKLDGGFGT